MKDTTRYKQIARIHRLARDLGLESTAYSQVLYALTGYSSSGLMPEADRRKVIDFLQTEASKQAQARRMASQAVRPVVTDEEAAWILG
jgi:hypothetical protein